jgi:rsbT co-antagonist protein RsbR
MSVNITSTLKNKKKDILELWMKNQLANPGLADDLISNQDLRSQSQELINVLVNSLNESNIGNVNSSDFDQVIEILGGISITRARQGFSPRETGFFVLSLKETLLENRKQQT